MMAANVTELPWVLGAYGEIWPASDVEFVNGKWLAKCAEPRIVPTSADDKAFIVRACNAHADLVKAVTAASHALRSYQHGNSSDELAQSVADACDAALEKARQP